MKSIPCALPLLGETSELLRVCGLTVTYSADSRKSVPALRQVDFQIATGEIVGVLGESGSGKSTFAQSILGLVPRPARVEGSILFRNQELLHADESRWQAIRGAEISLISQEPGLSLSPVIRVGDQVAEVIRAHRTGVRRKFRKQEAQAILGEVQLPDVRRIYKAYPHQLSGGELHRVAIAQALACRPDLVIADEPTRALDVTIQAEILNLLREHNRKLRTALIFITHNPALLAGFAHRVIVMYAGRIVEEGRLPQLFQRPLHPYTKALLQLAPRSVRPAHLTYSGRLPAIPGGPPDLKILSSGCAFEPRCAERTSICRSESPKEAYPEPGVRVRCLNHEN